MSAPSPRVVMIASPPRCASMWLYNVARGVLASVGRTVKPDDIAVGLNNQVRVFNVAAADPDPNATYTVKAHVVLAVEGGGVFTATSLRDPRDATLSYRRFTDAQDTVRPIAEAVSEYVAVYEQLRACWGERLFEARYDDIVTKPTKVTGDIRVAMGFPPNPDSDAAIAAAFAPDAVKRIIADAENDADKGVSLADIGQPRMMDRTTGFQSGHIGDGASGRWREAIATEQLAIIRERHGDWLQANGFALT